MPKGKGARNWILFAVRVSRGCGLAEINYSQTEPVVAPLRLRGGWRVNGRLHADAVGDGFQVEVSVAEGELGGFGTAGVELHVMLFGEAYRAVALVA